MCSNPIEVVVETQRSASICRPYCIAPPPGQKVRRATRRPARKQARPQGAERDHEQEQEITGLPFAPLARCAACVRVFCIGVGLRPFYFKREMLEGSARSSYPNLSKKKKRLLEDPKSADLGLGRAISD